MKKIKKLIALFLCTVMLISVFAGCGKKKDAQETGANATEESITKGEWLDLLASNFGSVNSTTEKPYFSNITIENDMFAKIQTLVEFGVIDKSEKLDLESYVTYKEMALNTLNIMGTDIVADYLETSNDLKEKDLLKFAKDKKIVSKTNNSYATKGEAQTAVDTAVNLYVNRPIIEKQDAKLKKGVKDIRKKNVSYENGNVTINDETKVSVGDIIILPATDEYPTGLARKVTAVNGNVLTTTEPELSEVYEKIDISATVVPKFSDITPVEQGVAIEEYSDIEGLSNSNTEANVITLSSNANLLPLAKKNEGLSISIPVNITKGKLSVDANWDALTLEMSKQNTKLDKNNIPFAYDKNGNQYAQKYTGGLEIKGKITVENLKFDVDFDWSIKDVIKSVSISPKFTTKIDLSIKGKAEGEELSVFKTAVPIGTTGVWVDCIFVIKVGVNGDITVKTKMVSESCTTYKKGKGITTVNNKNDFNNSAQISGNLTVGVGPKAVLTVLGIDIADAALVLGLGAKGTVKATQGSTELPCMDIKAYGPTASFTIGKDKNTILNKLGVSAEIKLIDLDGALVKPVWNTTYHWESNCGWMKSNECTGNKKKEENSSTNSSASSASQSSTNGATSSASQNNSNSSFQPDTSNKLPLSINWITRPKYSFDYMKSTLDGKSWIGTVQNSNHLTVNAKLIDDKGNLLFEAEDMKMSSEYNDRIIVHKNSQYGMISTNGTVVIPMQKNVLLFAKDYDQNKEVITIGDSTNHSLGHILDKNGNATGETLLIHGNDSSIGGFNGDKYLYNKSTNAFYYSNTIYKTDFFENKTMLAVDLGYGFDLNDNRIEKIPQIISAYIVDKIGDEFIMGEFEVIGYNGCGAFVNGQLKSKILYDSLEEIVNNKNWEKSLFSAGKIIATNLIDNEYKMDYEYYITNAFGEKILNETFEDIAIVSNQNSIPVKQNGKWGFISIPIL